MPTFKTIYPKYMIKLTIIPRQHLWIPNMIKVQMGYLTALTLIDDYIIMTQRIKFLLGFNFVMPDRTSLGIIW